MAVGNHHLIKARHVKFDFGETPLQWIPGDSASTHIIDTLNLLFPEGELWFTVFDAAQTRRDTVYTDRNGRYRITVDFAGELRGRTRTPYFRDAAQDLALAPDASKTLDFALAWQTVADELSASLPASAHLATLPWSSQDSRTTFISQCNYCHQVGNALTRTPRDEARGARPCAGWKATRRC
ncbi:putative metal-dependent hydrolase family protein [Burkholderia thailandensis MSMB121]|nr:putative metal-dependent hydrolase family protein [Burkholderia thailandensis MSMB121]